MMNGWLAVAVTAAVAAVLLGWPAPAYRRLGGADSLVEAWWREWCGDRPGRLGLRVRSLGAWAGGLTAGLLAARWSPWLWLAAPVVGVAAFLTLSLLPSGSAARRQARLRQGIPALCTTLAVTTEAGIPLRSAVAVLADLVPPPMAEVLARVRDRALLGSSDGEAWAALADEPALEGHARDLGRSADSGIALAGLLREQAREARRVARAEALVRARQVGVRSVVPLMACYLPAFVLVGVVPIVGGAVQRLFG